MRPGVVPVCRDLGTSRDGSRLGTYSAIGVAGHGSHSRVLDGVVGIPLALCSRLTCGRVVGHEALYVRRGIGNLVGQDAAVGDGSPGEAPESKDSGTGLHDGENGLRLKINEQVF